MPAPIGNNYAEGNKGGRPTKFTEETLQISRNYIAECKDYTDENGRLIVGLPTLKELATRLNVSVDTLTNWKNENEEFFGVYELLMAKQEKQLINNGLAGNYNPTITKLLLTKHGYTDKQEVEQKGDLNINIVKYGDNTTS